MVLQRVISGTGEAFQLAPTHALWHSIRVGSFDPSCCPLHFSRFQAFPCLTSDHAIWSRIMKNFRKLAAWMILIGFVSIAFAGCSSYEESSSAKPVQLR
jgi:hypothetical protein